MSTHRVPAKIRHGIAPTTRLGRLAIVLTVTAAVGLGMLAMAMAFSPDDPALSSAWGVYDALSVGVAGVFALAAPIVALAAVIRRERGLSIWLAVVPLLLILLHPLFMNG